METMTFETIDDIDPNNLLTVIKKAIYNILCEKLSDSQGTVEKDQGYSLEITSEWIIRLADIENGEVYPKIYIEYKPQDLLLPETIDDFDIVLNSERIEVIVATQS
jgi:hypothetical protein